MKHQNNFDFLRFIFAAIVVINHTCLLSNNSSLQSLTPFFNTKLAVCGFFIISGILISGSYNNTHTIGSYFEKRARRLLPNYLFIILICALLLSTISSLPLYEYFTNKELYNYLISNIFFLNFIQPTLPGVFTSAANYMPAVNGSLWTIKVEVLFYLTVPILYYIITRRCNHAKSKIIFTTILYFSSILWREFFLYLSKVTHSSTFYFLSYQLPGYMNYFASGIILYLFHSFFIEHKKIVVPIALAIYIIEAYFSVDIFTALALGIVIHFIAFSFKFLNNFGKYGDFSYGIYIVHFPIAQVYAHYGLFQQLPPYIALAITLLTTLLFAFFTWNVIEKPFLRQKR